MVARRRNHPSEGLQSELTHHYEGESEPRYQDECHVKKGCKYILLASNSYPMKKRESAREKCATECHPSSTGETSVELHRSPRVPMSR
jgi:hypothetical protein